jgi:hypothetical protein
MQKLFGGVLLGCGLLIAVLSGLCTLLAVGTSLLDTGSQSAAEFATMIPGVLIAGGIPVGIGLGLFFLGRHLLKTDSED